MATLGESPAPLARAELMAVKARVLVRKGALSEATQCVETAARLAGEDRGQIAEKIALAAARLTLAEGDTDRAIPALTASLTAAEARGRFGAAIEILILRSLALLRQGGLQEGCNDLERAIALAEPEGHVRVFLDEGQPMMALIAQWLARAGAHRSRRYAVRLLSQFDAEPQIALATQDTEHATGGLVETLSPRELEVLQLIAQGRTNQEIARELIVSVGTVKAHTASIYRKLDVANRTEAAARARRIGLLF